MKWFRRLMVKYEDWRVRMERSLVHDVILIQVEAMMEDKGILVVRDEKEDC
jgi:hypothetical protein